MKRGHVTSNGLEPIFCAPLTEGDLTDHISGDTFIVDGGASYSWNAQENAYHFNLTSSLSDYGGIRFPNISIDFGTTPNDIECTCVMDIKVPTSVSNSVQFVMLGTKYYYWNLQWYGGRESKNRWIRMAQIKEKGTNIAKIYQDGVFTANQTVITVMTRLNTLLIAKPSWCQPFNVYARNAYIFDRALSLEQIAAL